MQVVDEARSAVSCAEACDALGLPRASYHRERARAAATKHASKPRSHPRALNEQQRQHVVDVLNAERFANLAIPQVWAILLDEGQYLCSRSTDVSDPAKAWRSARAQEPTDAPHRGMTRSCGR